MLSLLSCAISCAQQFTSAAPVHDSRPSALQPGAASRSPRFSKSPGLQTHHRPSVRSNRHRDLLSSFSFSFSTEPSESNLTSHWMTSPAILSHPTKVAGIQLYSSLYQYSMRMPLA